MSEENALAFIAHVRNTPPLQERVAALKGDAVLARLVALGAESGYQFTEDEYRHAVVRLAEGELSDEALDDVRRELGLM